MWTLTEVERETEAELHLSVKKWSFQTGTISQFLVFTFLRFAAFLCSSVKTTVNEESLQFFTLIWCFTDSTINMLPVIIIIRLINSWIESAEHLFVSCLKLVSGQFFSTVELLLLLWQSVCCLDLTEFHLIMRQKCLLSWCERYEHISHQHVAACDQFTASVYKMLLILVRFS